MATREEIRAGTINAIMYGTGINYPEAEEIADRVLIFQADRGVVIRVEGELPKEGIFLPHGAIHKTNYKGDWLHHKIVRDIMAVAFQPLIEEVKP